MKRLISLLAVATLAACAKCYDGRYSETTATNFVGSDVTLTFCREDNPSSQQQLALVANQVKVFRWGDPEAIHEETKPDGQCPSSHDDEHVKIAVRLTAASQALAKLCQREDDTYELVATNQACANTTAEVTAVCP